MMRRNVEAGVPAADRRERDVYFLFVVGFALEFAESFFGKDDGMLFCVFAVLYAVCFKVAGEIPLPVVSFGVGVGCGHFFSVASKLAFRPLAGSASYPWGDTLAVEHTLSVA